MGRLAYVILICVLTFSGCADQSGGRYGTAFQSGSDRFRLLGSGSADQLLSTRGGKAAAILLPLTGPRADLGRTLLQAAQLGLQNADVPRFDIIDTGGTASGAASAATSAVNNGDALIIGPLTSAETAAVSKIARGAGIPVLAFTNDTSQSQPGIWTLGISPDQQIHRLVTIAQAQGKGQVAALLPDTDFGQALAKALVKESELQGLPAPKIRMHASGMAAITAAARNLSNYANRRGPIDAKIKEARALGTPEGRREAQELVKTAIQPPPFNVLLLADTGDELQEIAAIFPYFDVDRSMVQIIGPALWADPTSGSGAVTGGWYAAPDETTRSKFIDEFAAQYGAKPPPLADLAYDAAAIARVLMSSRGADLSTLTQPNGFVGSDGWIIFLASGEVRRGLAVFKLGHAGSTLIDPVPEPPAALGL